MKGIIAWWAKNSVAANLLMVLAFIGGLLGFQNMEREMFPQVLVNGASVSVTWPGAAPRDIEEQIVVRLEEVMTDIDGVKRISGYAREGVGYINIEAVNSIDRDWFIDEVKRRVDQINNLPQSSYPPQVSPWLAQNWYMGLAVYGDIDLRELKRIADGVRDEIARLPGGELAIVDGVLSEEVTIAASERELRQYGLTFDEVANAIRRASINDSGGRVRTETGQVSLQTRALADTEEQFSNIIVRQTREGSIIRVRDVATVMDGFIDEELKSTFNHKPTAFVFLRSLEKMDITKYTQSIRDYVDEANAGGLPEAVKIEVLWDDSKVFQDRLNTLSNSAIMGAFLVMIVLILFLRPIVAFWVTVGIITAFAGGFALMPYLGVSLNILSMFAFLLVIGVVVDDAIIVGERIHEEVESGRGQGLNAAIASTQFVAKPVIFGVITTLIAFAPWAMVTGPERQFSQQITYTVFAALIFSLIEAFLILPAHLSHLKPQEYKGLNGKFLRFQRTIADSMLWLAHSVYKPALIQCLRYRVALIVGFIMLFACSIGLIGGRWVPFNFMPRVEAELIQVRIEMPDGTPFSRSLEVRDQLERAIDTLTAESQTRFPGLEVDLIEGASIVASERNIRAWVGLAPPEMRPRDQSTTEYAEALRELLGPVPDSEEIEMQATFGDDGGGLRFALAHPDLDLLRTAADDLKRQLFTYGALYDVGDNLNSAAEEVRFTLKPGAEALGITLRDVSRQIRQAYYGEEVQRLPRNGDDVRVMVRYDKDARTSLDSLNSFRIRLSDGRQIPLTEIADWEFAPGIRIIIRRDRMRSAYVFAEVTGDARGDIMKDLNENFFPEFEQRYPEIVRENTGSAEDEANFFKEITQLYLISLALMYFLLAIAFGSYSQPILIMTAIPFGLAGAIFGHWLFGVPMAMFSIFGIAAGAGVVINDNLVLVDYVNKLRQKGMGAIEAVVTSATSRFRPIVLTSVTTFVGILPIMLERSTQAEFLKPMALSLGCAVAFSVFVSLLMVPGLYIVGVEIGRFLKWAWSGRPYERIGGRYEQLQNDSTPSFAE